MLASEVTNALNITEELAFWDAIYLIQRILIINSPLIIIFSDNYLFNRVSKNHSISLEIKISFSIPVSEIAIQYSTLFLWDILENYKTVSIKRSYYQVLYHT